MFLTRLILSLVLIAGVAVLLWTDHRMGKDFGFLIIIFCTVVLSVGEFYDLVKARGYTPWSVWGMICAGLMVLADSLGYSNIRPEMHWVGVVGFVFVAGLFLLQGWLRPRPNGVVSMALTGFAIAYVWGLGHFIMRIRYLPGIVGIRGVLLLVATVKFSDIAAYLIGKPWGRHRPFPQVSPLKSWEGYVAGLLGAVSAAVVTGWLLFENMTWIMAVVFAVPVCVFGQLGDLAESIIKRDLGVKDSGIRFPGLGGVLDVVDSLLLAGPVAFYILEQMVFRQWL